MLTSRGTLAIVLLLSTAIVSVHAAEVTQQRLENADSEPQNWLTVHGDYSAQNFSRLDQINRDNVKNLHVAFTVPIPTALVGTPLANLEGPVLVDGGMLYFNDAWGTTYKVDATDATNPKILWTTDPAVDKSFGAQGFYTRGEALWGNNIYANLIDGRVIAMNASTGEIVFDKQIAGKEGDWKYAAAEGFTGAPLAVEGKILVGQSKGDWGTRGYLAAVDATTGNQVWRTYTVPAPGEPGSETWKDNHNAWHTGGGAVWVTGSYDPAQKLTFWGAANGVPMFDPEFRPGDNLFTNSLLALDINTGKMKYYFQYTPNDSWDYDEVGVHFLYDETINGQPRKVIGHFGRNGFFYQLDRVNGSFINSTMYVDKVNWTAGIDPKTGKPVEYDPTKDVQTYIPATRGLRGNPNVTVCPSHIGGIRWQPPSYNATTHTAYAAGLEGCTDIKVTPVAPVVGGGDPNGVNAVFTNGVSTPHLTGSIVALDMNTMKVKAKAELPFENLSGALDTAGGIVFTGNLDGSVAAYKDDDLTPLWKFPTSISIKAPAVAYSVNGKEYIAILAGGQAAAGGHPELATMKQGAMLYVFTL